MVSRPPDRIEAALRLAAQIADASVGETPRELAERIKAELEKKMGVVVSLEDLWPKP